MSRPGLSHLQVRCIRDPRLESRETELAAPAKGRGGTRGKRDGMEMRPSEWQEVRALFIVIAFVFLLDAFEESQDD